MRKGSRFPATRTGGSTSTGLALVGEEGGIARAALVLTHFEHGYII